MKILGFIYRNTVEFSDIYTPNTLHISLVTSILKYASIIWFS